MSAQDIYDFEGILPPAVATVFKAAGMNAFTALDDPQTQLPRPRVEIFFKLGASPVSGPLAASAIVNGQRRNAAWSGSLEIHAITDVSAPGKLVHSAYRAAVRNLCATLQYNINGVEGGLLRHKLQLLVEESTVHGIRTQDGYEQSTITFTAYLSVQADAWVLLND